MSCLRRLSARTTTLSQAAASMFLMTRALCLTKRLLTAPPTCVATPSTPSHWRQGLLSGVGTPARRHGQPPTATPSAARPAPATTHSSPTAAQIAHARRHPRRRRRRRQVRVRVRVCSLLHATPSEAACALSFSASCGFAAHVWCLTRRRGVRVVLCRPAATPAAARCVCACARVLTAARHAQRGCVCFVCQRKLRFCCTRVVLDTPPRRACRPLQARRRPRRRRRQVRARVHVRFCIIRLARLRPALVVSARRAGASGACLAACFVCPLSPQARRRPRRPLRQVRVHEC
jgi:hypothetical protein